MAYHACSGACRLDPAGQSSCSQTKHSTFAFKPLIVEHSVSLARLTKLTQVMAHLSFLGACLLVDIVDKDVAPEGFAVAFEAIPWTAEAMLLLDGKYPGAKRMGGCGGACGFG